MYVVYTIVGTVTRLYVCFSLLIACTLCCRLSCCLQVDNGQPIVYFFDQDMNVLGTPNEIGFRGLFLREDAALQQHLDQVAINISLYIFVYTYVHRICM